MRTAERLAVRRRRLARGWRGCSDEEAAEGRFVDTRTVCAARADTKLGRAGGGVFFVD
jgi:hypothetical protein